MKKNLITGCIKHFVKVAKKSSVKFQWMIWKIILSTSCIKHFTKVIEKSSMKSHLRFRKMILSTVLSNISIKSLRNLQWNLIKWFEEWSYHSSYQTICQNRWEIFSKIIIKYSMKSYQEFEKESYQMFC